MWLRASLVTATDNLSPTVPALHTRPPVNSSQTDLSLFIPFCWTSPWPVFFHPLFLLLVSNPFLQFSSRISHFSFPSLSEPYLFVVVLSLIPTNLLHCLYKSFCSYFTSLFLHTPLFLCSSSFLQPFFLLLFSLTATQTNSLWTECSCIFLEELYHLFSILRAGAKNE